MRKRRRREGEGRAERGVKGMSDDGDGDDGGDATLGLGHDIVCIYVVSSLKRVIATPSGIAFTFLGVCGFLHNKVSLYIWRYSIKPTCSYYVWINLSWKTTSRDGELNSHI